jgi:hypothetical protein
MSFDDAASFNHCASNCVRSLVRDFDGHEIYFVRSTLEAVVESLH